MPAYTFEALDAQGATQKGLIDADTARSARSLLRARALVPLMVEPATGGGTNVQGSGLNVTLWGGRVFSATTLAVWTRQMAGLVAAGLPLERALSALTEEAEDDKQRNLMASLRSEVNAGSPFAQALAQHPREFSSIYTSVIAAGEQSGQLGTVLERLADDLEEREALKNKLVAASLYPAIVTLVAIVIVVFLVSYVVPQVANVFAGSKRALPLLTVMMLGLSDFVRSYGWLMLGALVLGSGALVMARRNEALRLRMDAAWLRLPLVGRLARGFNAARFAATLAMLAAAGVPILRALQTAAETLNNQAMRADALDALVLVREGAPLASALASKKRFPPLVSMFARLGEQTGQLPAMLDRAAEQLGAEVQRRAMHMATILEPLLIVGMGVVVMLIVLAVLMPIIQLNQLVT
ncbi:MAG: type II secretion system inner membrane protein GspF [Hydrogenophaga sp.]|jgi:general secretion pathway protein F|uniref:type II secretion system inner membrane protein GspF n=1 Tax=Hydrogenophaga sp. TaxID=1904254 RepID=UPI002730C670|nr:type II secretion system inner membrane protein GspF [Hydrogenophaga sp.]MDP2250375.1 type II secretion system inner membrane protein GspF [Hydrogenophaga sp.]MDP3352042.1 type II secretion system inner membrane protein GspF [Hydrogenophaga sp.]MDZ4399822.1 type II secretion system inner membrane protein GspF [Hydrogenophaga sp.]